MTAPERALLLESHEDLREALNALDNHLLGEDSDSIVARHIERVLGRFEGLLTCEEEEECDD